jgi:hypothetical protein
LSPEPLIAVDGLVDRVALLAHGLAAGSGGSMQHSLSPTIATVRSMMLDNFRKR